MKAYAGEVTVEEGENVTLEIPQEQRTIKIHNIPPEIPEAPKKNYFAEATIGLIVAVLAAILIKKFIK